MHNSFCIFIVLMCRERWKQEEYYDNCNKTIACILGDLFSLESLQFNKWAWHHHWAGDKLAHFPLVYLPRPLGSAFWLKRSFHKLLTLTNIPFRLRSAFSFSSLASIVLPLSDCPASLSHVLTTLQVHLLWGLWPLLLSARYASGTWRKDRTYLTVLRIAGASACNGRHQSEVLPGTTYGIWREY